MRAANDRQRLAMRSLADQERKPNDRREWLVRPGQELSTVPKLLPKISIRFNTSAANAVIAVVGGWCRSQFQFSRTVVNGQNVNNIVREYFVDDPIASSISSLTFSSFFSGTIRPARGNSFVKLFYCQFRVPL